MPLAVLACAALASAQQSWEFIPSEQRWQKVDAAATRPVKEPTLDRVEQSLLAGSAATARKTVVQWLKANKQSPVRDRGLYYLGEANFLLDRRINAFYNFDELLDYYPASPWFHPALQRQYDIADAFLRGHKRKILGLRIFGAREEAIEMLFRIQQRAPGSPLAEKSLLRTADYYYDNAEFDLAADAYAAFARSYPRSPELERVRLRQAFSSLAQFRGLKFDATPIIDARQQLADIAALHPDLSRQQNLPAIRQRIEQTLARKDLDRADFYRRTDKPQSAAWHYQYVIRSFPNLSEAEEARRKMAELPKWAVETLSIPPVTRPYEKPAQEEEGAVPP